MDAPSRNGIDVPKWSFTVLAFRCRRRREVRTARSLRWFIAILEHPEQTERGHLTNVTGTSTRCSTFVAIEPISRPEMAPMAPEPRPRVPMITWSQFRSRT